VEKVELRSETEDWVEEMKTWVSPQCHLLICICVLCLLSVYHPGVDKSHDDPDGTHHSSGADPRYIADLNRPLGMQRRQVGDIIRTPATPCEL
jgi:hypothetical protein